MSSNTKKILIIIFVIVAIVLWQSDQSTPDSFLYGAKRLQEKAFLTIQSTPQKKVDYYSSLLDERLKEINFLTKNNKTKFLWSASLRYSTTAGEISKIITDNKLTSYVLQTIAKFKAHQQVFKNLDNNFPDRFNNEDWKFLQDGSNYLEQYIQQLSKIN